MKEILHQIDIGIVRRLSARLEKFTPEKKTNITVND
jgi:hypothetical protein